MITPTKHNVRSLHCDVGSLHYDVGSLHYVAGSLHYGAGSLHYGAGSICLNIVRWIAHTHMYRSKNIPFIMWIQRNVFEKKHLYRQQYST
jgi:hypothetical protein